MPLPVTKVLYCTTGSYSGSGFAALSETAPNVFTASAFGWNMGQNNPPLYCEMYRGVEVLRNTAGRWFPRPSGSGVPNNTIGNCWAFGPLNGEFLSASWQITMSVKAITRSDGQVGNFIYRFWQGSNVSGSNATLITPTFYTSSRNTSESAGATPLIVSRLTSSISLPNIRLKNEYLFIQTYWSIVTAGGNNGDDENLVFGISASVIKPTSFVADYPQFMACSDDGMG
jgi:hypothetical protein